MPRIDFAAGFDPFVISRKPCFETGHAQAERFRAASPKLSGVYAIRVIVAAHTAWIERAAEELVYRDAQRFSANIPQRLVDGRNCRAHNRSRAIKTVHVHRLPDVLHLHRIGADDEITEIVDTGHRRAGLAFKRTFAPTDKPLIRLKLAKYIRPVGVAGKRNAEHLHTGYLEARAQVPECLSSSSLALGMIGVACIDGLKITSARVDDPRTGDRGSHSRVVPRGRRKQGRSSEKPSPVHTM